MSMTRKDFEIVAAALRRARAAAEQDASVPVRLGVGLAASHLALALEEAFPPFDRTKFLLATWPDQDVEEDDGIVFGEGHGHRRTRQHTPETCPGRPCSTECDHVEFLPT